MNEEHIGDTLDDFLEKENLLAEAEAIAKKRAIIFQNSQLAARKNLLKVEAERKNLNDILIC